MNIEVHHIPELVADEETVLRTVFSPAHVNNNGKVRPSCLKPRMKFNDEDDETQRSNKVSVTRLQYASLEFCRKHALSHLNGAQTFWGFVQLLVKDIRECECEVIYKPVDDNPAHANIVFPFCLSIEEDPEPLNAEITKKARDILAKAKIIKNE